ncbi:MAG: 4-phospho-D-threonate 3-dehydrogenase, partial [Fibrobacter sp.]|nr:4-phospho-D-threonate 3-dehydrogenase [Fibrobacter sp.]
MKQNISNDPIFALTMGDPAGIGPEIAIKALSSKIFKSRVVIIGDLNILEETARSLHLNTDFNAVTDDFTNYSVERINVLDLNALRSDQFEIGKVSAACGYASFL